MTGIGACVFCPDCERRNTKPGSWRYGIGDKIVARVLHVDGSVWTDLPATIIDKVECCAERHLFFCNYQQRKKEPKPGSIAAAKAWEKLNRQLLWDGAEQGIGYLIYNKEADEIWGWKSFMIAESHIVGD